MHISTFKKTRLNKSKDPDTYVYGGFTTIILSIHLSIKSTFKNKTSRQVHFKTKNLIWIYLLVITGCLNTQQLVGR